MMTGQLVAIAFPAFVASLVEFVEALTIVLAVGTTRGWRSALAGTTAGVLVLALLVAAFGPALAYAPLQAVQIGLGIPMGDETERFARTALQLGEAVKTSSLDGPGVFTAFNGVVVEGLEIVFIVIAVGASSKNLTLAALGAGVAGVIIVALAVALRTPLARVPANTLKFVVGLMLASLGTLWLGEGMGVAWPGDDASALGIGVAFLAASAIGIRLGRRRENLRKARATA